MVEEHSAVVRWQVKIKSPNALAISPFQQDVSGKLRGGCFPTRAPKPLCGFAKLQRQIVRFGIIQKLYRTGL